MFLYIAHNFWLTNFLLRFTCRSPPSPSRGPAIYVFLVTSRCFAFRELITQARIWKSFELKTRQVYFIYPFPRRSKLEKSLETCRVNFFSLEASWADILSEKNPYFGKYLFCKTKTDYAYKLRVQDFATGKNFSFYQCSKQERFAFFSGKLFYKSNRKLFSCVCISWYKHSRGWENSRKLCKPETKSRVCITVENPPNP